MSTDRPDAPNSWPPAELAAEWLRRLSAGDRLVTSEFAAAYIEPLVAFLRTRYRQVDDHLRQEAAEQALVSLFKNPTRFNPDRGELGAYLRMSADKDLLNLLEKERKHHENRKSWDPVELDVADRNTGGGAEDDLPSFDHPALAPVIAAFDDAERRAFELMRAGERRTAVFAAALGLTDRPPAGQADEVKRVKDKIMQRLRRAWRGHRE